MNALYKTGTTCKGCLELILKWIEPGGGEITRYKLMHEST